MGIIKHLFSLYTKIYTYYILKIHFMLVIFSFLMYFYFILSNPEAKFVFDWYTVQGSFVLISLTICLFKPKIFKKYIPYLCIFLSLERGLFYIFSLFIPLDPIAAILFIEGLFITYTYYNFIFFILSYFPKFCSVIIMGILNYVIAFFLMYGETKYFDIAQRKAKKRMNKQNSE